MYKNKEEIQQGDFKEPKEDMKYWEEKILS